MLAGQRCPHQADARWNRRLRNASPNKGVRRPPIYFRIKRRDMRMLDEIVLDLAPLEGGSEAWEPKPDSSFVRLHQRGDEEPLDSQALLLEEGF